MRSGTILRKFLISSDFCVIFYSTICHYVNTYKWQKNGNFSKGMIISLAIIYHTEEDTIDNIDFDFMYDCVKASIATLCIQADIQ